jgi:hypothetical protein
MTGIGTSRRSLQSRTGVVLFENVLAEASTSIRFGSVTPQDIGYNVFEVLLTWRRRTW